MVKATFCTSPAIKNTWNNLFLEIMGTFILILSIFMFGATALGNLNPLAVSLVVLGIGLCLGVTTGYAINPARDFGLRIIYWVLYKKFDKSYFWIPIAGPIIGSLFATFIYILIK